MKKETYYGYEITILQGVYVNIISPERKKDLSERR
jgi:hypothetical protein